MSLASYQNKILCFGLGSIIIGYYPDFTKAKAADLTGSSSHIIVDKKNDLQNIEDGYENGKVLIFDNKNIEESESNKKIMEHSSGISIDNAPVLLRKGANGPEFIVMPSDISESEKNFQIEKFEQKRKRVKRSSPAENQLKKPSVTITVLKRNLSCKMNMYKGYEDYPEYMKDYCDKRAFVELNYKIDMYGSIALQKTDEKTGAVTRTEDGKYLVITVSPFEEGGTGWHITDEIKEEVLWGNFLGSRNEFVGPFASKYNFWVQSDEQNPNVRLVATFPQNTNPEMSVNESRGVTVGMKGGIKFGVDKDLNPSGSIDLDISRQVTETRNVSFKTYEYYVENNSYDGAARWTWNSKMNEAKMCNALTTKDFGGLFGDCYFTRFVLNDDKVINKEKLNLSAISYKSFTPSFQAIYKADKNEVGESTFSIGTSAEVGVILGSVSMGIATVGGYYWYFPSYTAKPIPEVNAQERFTVDWSSPFFEPEQNVRLQNMNGLSTTKCLSVEKRDANLKSENGIVNLETCQDERGQIWGYDNEEKVFKSRVDKNSCLTYIDDHNFAVRSCAYVNSQKWIINSDGNIQLYVDNNKILGEDAAGNLKIVNPDSSEKIKFEAFKAKL
ncbi:leukocidin family pore-forming toxin [Fluviispira vulneris]|uniref:leukocidin family pore-forming toxin n=1 Tax=Fluviispira vulneris TaxID=2763012 RepID=UPI001647A9E6|nr:leukocidin family pore-forming toxin [Fluviispira vulneris]